MSLAVSASPCVAPAFANAAEPVLRVRGKAEVDLAAGWLDGHLIVSGAARDETGRPLAGAVLSLVGRGPTGTTVELAGGTPCSPLAEADKVPQGTPEERSLRTDRAGRFCVDFEGSGSGDPPNDVEARFTDPQGLLDPVARRVMVDRNRRAVELRFVDPPAAIDVDEPNAHLELGIRSEPPATASRQSLPVVLFARAAGKERLLAQLPCRLGGTVVFSLPGADLGPPGPVDLIARFAGTESFQPAETLRRISRTARVTLSLGKNPEPGDPESGIPIDIAVGSARGAVSSGAVEARLGGETVGIAKVEDGVAHVVTRFSRSPERSAALLLHYLPSEPWWLPAPPLKVEVALAPRSHWSSIAWLFGFVAIAAWLLSSWRRPARTTRTERSGTAPRARAAAVVVVEADESATGWRGVVRDAHDETPIAGAHLAIFVDEPEGPRALLRVTADELGRFELPAVAANGDARFVVSARWHATLTVRLPRRGKLEVDLVTRRRQLVARFVAWAAREGHGAKGRSEPTPGEVRQAARRLQREDIVEWADAIEGAAYGPEPVDEPVERGVLDREPTEQGEPRKPSPH
jgi:hypothetical protein